MFASCLKLDTMNEMWIRMNTVHGLLRVRTTDPIPVEWMKRLACATPSHPIEIQIELLEWQSDAFLSRLLDVPPDLPLTVFTKRKACALSIEGQLARQHL